VGGEVGGGGERRRKLPRPAGDGALEPRSVRTWGRACEPRRIVARAGVLGAARVWRSHARGRAPAQAPHRCTLACDIRCGGQCEQQQNTDTGSRRTIKSAVITLLPEASE